MADLLWLLAGFACAAAGGDLFVSGAVRGAAALRVPPAFIGATVAAFATSSPELSVAIATSLADEGALAFGNLAGANVVNLTLVLGIALLLVLVATHPEASLIAVTSLYTASGPLAWLYGAARRRRSEPPSPEPVVEAQPAP